MKDLKNLYKDSGVDVTNADEIVKELKNTSKADKNVIEGIGGFASICNIPEEIKDPVSLFATDGVGTKLLIAKKLNDYSTIGIDLVAMCVNDIVAQGGKPYFFLDYLGCESLQKDKALELLRGIKKGCELADVSLVGGETAEMPNFYKKDTYDLVGFTVGYMERDLIGRHVDKGDILIGVKSSGLHSNGFSLVNRLLEGMPDNVYREFLTPTHIYTKPFAEFDFNKKIKGAAHITGGGITGNVSRILRNNLSAHIAKEHVDLSGPYKHLLDTGKVTESDLLEVFNCGLGLVLAVENKDVDFILKRIRNENFTASVIGDIRDEPGTVIIA